MSLNNFNNTAVVYTYHRYLHYIIYILINLTDCYFVFVFFLILHDELWGKGKETKQNKVEANGYISVITFSFLFLSPGAA